MWTARPGNKIAFEDECARMRLLDETSPLSEGSEALDQAADDLRIGMISGAILQLQAFLAPDAPPMDKEQQKRFRKAERHLRKMGWPKTAIGNATWRKLYQVVAPHEMTLREASERNDDHLAKGMIS